MKVKTLVMVCIGFFLSCDPHRVYEKNLDFEDRHWLVSEKPTFDFEITDTGKTYNLYANIRNELVYPNANVYFTWILKDSTNKALKEQLLTEFLFEQKTGKPIGNTVLGDIYDHRFPLLIRYSFPGPGKYHVTYEQFMRRDTLPGILSIGLRVEENATE